MTNTVAVPSWWLRNTLHTNRLSFLPKRFYFYSFNFPASGVRMKTLFPRVWYWKNDPSIILRSHDSPVMVLVFLKYESCTCVQYEASPRSAADVPERLLGWKRQTRVVKELEIALRESWLWPWGRQVRSRQDLRQWWQFCYNETSCRSSRSVNVNPFLTFSFCLRLIRSINACSYVCIDKSILDFFLYIKLFKVFRSLSGSN